MRTRNHAGASGRWCRCDTARLHFFHNKALPLIQRGQLDEMSEHWPMLEGPKDVTGEAKVGFDAWAVKHYTRPRAGAAAVTEDPTELKRLLDCALEVAHAHTLPQIPRGRPPSERSEYKITMNFGGGRYMGKTLEEAGHTDYEGAGFLRWVAGYGTSAFVWHNTADSILLAQSFERLTKRSAVFHRPAAQQRPLSWELRRCRSCDWPIAPAEGHRRPHRRHRRVPGGSKHARQQRPPLPHDHSPRRRPGESARHRPWHYPPCTHRHAAARSPPGVVVGAVCLRASLRLSRHGRGRGGVREGQRQRRR